jgi:hypothetical protein
MAGDHAPRYAGDAIVMKVFVKDIVWLGLAGVRSDGRLLFPKSSG